MMSWVAWGQRFWVLFLTVPLMQIADRGHETHCI